MQHASTRGGRLAAPPDREILGDARLRGDSRVLRVLAVLLEEIEDERLPQASADALVTPARSPQYWRQYSTISLKRSSPVR